MQASVIYMAGALYFLYYDLGSRSREVSPAERKNRNRTCQPLRIGWNHLVSISVFTPGRDFDMSVKFKLVLPRERSRVRRHPRREHRNTKKDGKLRKGATHMFAVCSRRWGPSREVRQQEPA